MASECIALVTIVMKASSIYSNAFLYTVAAITFTTLAESILSSEHQQQPIQ